MYKQEGVIMEDTGICLSCWSNLQQTQPKGHISYFSSGPSQIQGKQKKISLRKSNQSRSKLIQSKQDHRQSYSQQNNQITPRKIDRSDSQRDKSIFIRSANLPIQVPLLKEKLSLQETTSKKWQQQANNEMGRYLARPDSRLLTKTTKFQRIAQEQLKKTIKAGAKGISLNQLRQSCISFTQKSDSAERFQESIILVDYFHPSEDKLKQLESYCKDDRKGCLISNFTTK